MKERRARERVGCRYSWGRSDVRQNSNLSSHKPVSLRRANENFKKAGPRRGLAAGTLGEGVT